jgi:hypothetical protein
LQLKLKQDKIHLVEQRRLDYLQKFQQKEKNNEKRLKLDHQQLLDRMQTKEELRKQKEQERYEKLKEQEKGFKNKRDLIMTMQQQDKVI